MQPRIAGCGLKSRVRHYTNPHRMRPRLWRLLREFQWDRMDRVYGEIIDSAGLPAARLSVVPA